MAKEISMGKKLFFLVCVALCLVFVSCESTEDGSIETVAAPVVEPVKPVVEAPKVEPKKEEPKPAVAEPVKAEPAKPAPVKEPEKTIIVPKEEPIVEPVKIVEDYKSVKHLTEEEKEYQRSVKDLTESISIDEFEADKKEVLAIIDDLTRIMKDRDYNSWVKYLSPASKKYWSNPQNLATVSNRLPVKGLKISSLKDYFTYVFVPARANSKVEEIRYVSSTVVKAVEPHAEEDLIYYMFEKTGGKWYLKLDTL